MSVLGWVRRVEYDAERIVKLSGREVLQKGGYMVKKWKSRMHHFLGASFSVWGRYLLEDARIIQNARPTVKLQARSDISGYSDSSVAIVVEE